jgi:recombination protein RecA
MAKAKTEVENITGITLEDLAKDLKTKLKKGIDFHDSDLQSISTGSVKLDWALRLPYLEGQMVELYGAAGSGKTTCALHVCQNAMKLGKYVFYFDLEYKLREAQLLMIKGFNRDLFNIIYPDHAEDAMDTMQRIVKEYPGCLIILDSVGGLLPEVEDAESYEKLGMATIARMLHKMVRKITGYAARNKCVIIFLNHLTATMEMYGSKSTTHGGNAVKNRAAQRIELFTPAADAIKVDDVKIGQYVRATVTKNNVNRPFITVSFPIIYGRGIDQELEIMEFALDLGIITKSGAWMTIPEPDNTDGKKIQREDLMTRLRSDEPFKQFILSKIKAVV